MFEIMIWAGTGITLLGLAGLVWCIIRAARLRTAGLDEAALREQLQAILPVNLGALFLSAVGLMLVVVGVLLR